MWINGAHVRLQAVPKACLQCRCLQSRVSLVFGVSGVWNLWCLASRVCGVAGISSVYASETVESAVGHAAQRPMYGCKRTGPLHQRLLV